ncbi:RNA helicase, putative [Plasmodium ovale curtisi]|uniref:RNA helicase n=1 Tax=Plasmodium ovale curtisi TaxID=864141 RepID=A0A1A8VM13_PLAOA|nr:RNA helicase, putative [Plasmodium ovale curtisi]
MGRERRYGRKNGRRKEKELDEKIRKCTTHFCKTPTVEGQYNLISLYFIKNERENKKGIQPRNQKNRSQTFPTVVCNMKDNPQLGEGGTASYEHSYKQDMRQMGDKNYSHRDVKCETNSIKGDGDNVHTLTMSRLHDLSHDNSSSESRVEAPVKNERENSSLNDVINKYLMNVDRKKEGNTANDMQSGMNNNFNYITYVDYFNHMNNIDQVNSATGYIQENMSINTHMCNNTDMHGMSNGDSLTNGELYKSTFYARNNNPIEWAQSNGNNDFLQSLIDTYDKTEANIGSGDISNGGEVSVNTYVKYQNFEKFSSKNDQQHTSSFAQSKHNNGRYYVSHSNTHYANHTNPQESFMKNSMRISDREKAEDGREDLEGNVGESRNREKERTYGNRKTYFYDGRKGLYKNCYESNLRELSPPPLRREQMGLYRASRMNDKGEFAKSEEVKRLGEGRIKKFVSKWDDDIGQKKGFHPGERRQFRSDEQQQFRPDEQRQFRPDEQRQFKPDEHRQFRPDEQRQFQPDPQRPNSYDKKYECNIFDDECYFVKCKIYGEEKVEVPEPLNFMEDLSEICGEMLYKNICVKGYSQMTTVQKYSIPIIKKKINLIASSQTGSGKTFSFLCPVISNIKKDNEILRPHFPGAYACITPLCLVLCPTRELVIQIQNEVISPHINIIRCDIQPCIVLLLYCNTLQLGTLSTCILYTLVNSLTKNMDIVCMAFYGGETMKDQIVQINERQADVVVSTPGRLLDLLNNCKVSLSFVQYLIFDEADEMISLGLKNQMNEIIFEKDLCPGESRQTIFFTATLSDNLREDIEKFMATPYVYLHIKQKRDVKNSVKQIVKYVPMKSKLNELFRDVRTLQGQAIVFVELRNSINHIFSFLKSKGFEVNYLHGKMSQVRRQTVFEQFRDKSFQILIATSIAARGLDFPDLELVINYDLPSEFDQYMHRIGRTGRIGKSGIAINYVNSSNRKIIDKLIEHLKKYDQVVPNWLLNFNKPYNSA